MHKKLIAIPLTALMSLGLTACGTNNDSAVQERNNDLAQPIGYYSNENHGNRGGNARIEDGSDNDGPLTEMMDHSLGGERTDREILRENGQFSRTDANYHAHLGTNDARKARNSYYNAYEGDLSEKIHNTAASVENVDDVSSVINGDKVIIALNLKDHKREAATIAAVRKAVKPLLKGKSYKVVADQSTLSRLRTIDNDLRDGGPREQIELDIENLFRADGNR